MCRCRAAVRDKLGGGLQKICRARMQPTSTSCWLCTKTRCSKPEQSSGALRFIAASICIPYTCAALTRHTAATSRCKTSCSWRAPELMRTPQETQQLRTGALCAVHLLPGKHVPPGHLVHGCSPTKLSGLLACLHNNQWHSFSPERQETREWWELRQGAVPCRTCNRRAIPLWAWTVTSMSCSSTPSSLPFRLRAAWVHLSQVRSAS